MKLASLEGVGFLERQAFRAFRLRKRCHQALRYRRGCAKVVVLVVGCQRSGTSMIHHVLRRDLDAVTYDEQSPLSSRDHVEQLRWNPPAEIQARFAADRAPLVVAKPLVESQNLVRLLDLFPESRALWMYRHFADVAESNVKYFGPDTGHADLVPILADDQGNWRAEGLGVDARERIRRLYRRDLTPHDTAALFWYARNSLLFSGGGAEDSRVRACRYADLVERPAAVMRAIYGFVGRPYPGDGIVRDVFAGSRGRGRNVSVSPPVRAACEEILERLDAAPRVGAR